MERFQILGSHLVNFALLEDIQNKGNPFVTIVLLDFLVILDQALVSNVAHILIMLFFPKQVFVNILALQDLSPQLVKLLGKY